MATGEVKCIDDEIPFEIPEGWEWVRISDITQPNPKNVVSNDTPAAFIPMEKIDATYLSSYTYATRKWGDIKNGFTHFANGDIAFAKITPCFQNRKSVILKDLPNGIGAGTTELKVLRTYGDTIVKEYLLFFLESPYFVEEAIFKGTANQQRIISGYLENKLFPLPPFSEQKRIVGKIMEAFVVADKYGKAQSNLDILNSNLRALLRKSVLQEAIQGRLVPQIPEEGTAQELLEQIKQEKARLVKEGKLKKTALQDSVIFKGGDNKYYEQVGSQVSVIEEDIPFDIPDSWCWMRLGCLVYCETGLAYSKDNLNEKSESMIRVLRGGNIDEGRWSVKDDDVMISSKYVREELLLKRGTFITPAVTSLERMAKTALIETDLYDTVAGGFVLMLKPFFKHDAILGYLNLLFQTTYYKQYCIGITNKSGQAFYNLSRQKLMKCMIPIAPIKEMIRIVTKYESLDL